MRSNVMKKIVTMLVAAALIISMMPLMADTAYGASVPGKVKKFKGEVKANTIELDWGEVKGAKKYQIFVKKGKGKWKFKKSVRDDDAEFRKNSWNTKYYFKVRAVRGNKKGKFSRVLVAKIGKKVTLESVYKSSRKARAEINEIAEDLSTETMKTSLAFKGNRMIMTLAIQENYTADQIKMLNAEMKPELNSKSGAKEMKEAIRDLEDESGLSGVSLKLVFTDIDGTYIVAKTFK